MSDRILVASRKGLFTLERSRGRWSVARREFLGDHLSYVMADPRTGALFAAFQHGHFGVKLQRSTDGGESWAECGQPTYPEKPADEVDNDPMRGKPVPWVVERVWAMAPGLSDQPGVLWLGTIPGGLFRSGDGGEHWELVRPLWDHPDRKQWFGGGADLPGVHSILVDPRDGRRVLVGVSCGGVWETTDGGETWDCRADGMIARYMPPDRQTDPVIQDPHRVVMCRAQPDALWAQHHNGIFRSTDGSRSWSEIRQAGPSTFGFGVAVHPEQPDTAWFVPAQKDEQRIPVDGRLVVTRTRDGGQRFDVLTRGLPQERAWDLVFRHALDIDRSGERLAFGSTTGGLWITEDQGDSWEPLAERLPPIDALCFVA
jgi:photosystem II stability/assembly factor-like uncharacterized protein